LETVPVSVAASINDIIPLGIWTAEGFVASTTLVRVPIVRKATTPGRMDASDINLPGITLGIAVGAYA